MTDEHDDPYFGFAPDLVWSLTEGVPRDPVTGAFKLESGNTDEKALDLSTFFSAPVLPQTLWVLHMDHIVFVDPEQVQNDSGSADERLPRAILYWSGDKPGYPTRTAEYCGTPDSETVLGFLQRSIADPCPQQGPCLPDFMLISMELREHTSVLRPFLRSFLSPFTWMFESRALSRLLQCTQAKDSYKWLIELAIDANKRGIAELASANRANAMHAYTEAIQHIHFAGLVALEEKQKEAVKTLYSVCLANRACALLQSGEKMDACFALLDAEASEVLSPGFSKAYHCQWKAHEILGNVYASQDVTERALKNIGLGHWRQLRNDWSHRRDIASRKRTATSSRPE